ncbi:MAG: argininosuccinate lyase [Rhodothermales bacterium]
MLWKKDTDVAAWVTRFTVGEDYRWDTRLLPYDVDGTRGHARGLARIGILTGEELKQIEQALDDIRPLAVSGELVVRLEDEDCHTVLEGELVKRLGDTGKRIHTGRSRNDQVLTALRLFLKDRVRQIAAGAIDLATALCDLGARHERSIMPGYTHLQRAMPTTAGLWAMGYAELLVSDLAALKTAFDQVDTSPLGSAAGYGVPYLDLPRAFTAEALGFTDVQTHVTAVQLSRGKLELHVVHAFAQVAATLNRMASDLVLFNTSEFAFVRLPAAFCTGSSIMPQKQNPDVLELIRASYHRVIAEMQILLTLPANMPSGYHRDLQLTKEATMRSEAVTTDMLDAMRQLLPGVEFDLEAMRRATSSELFATAAALEKVAAGMPFRDAYREAAREVSQIGQVDLEQALDAYKVAGFPGKLAIAPIRERVAAFAGWAGKN